MIAWYSIIMLFLELTGTVSTRSISFRISWPEVSCPRKHKHMQDFCQNMNPYTGKFMLHVKPISLVG